MKARYVVGLLVCVGIIGFGCSTATPKPRSAAVVRHPVVMAARSNVAPVRVAATNSVDLKKEADRVADNKARADRSVKIVAARKKLEAARAAYTAAVTEYVALVKAK